MANYTSVLENGAAVDAELIKVRDSNLNPAHKITRSATLVIAASNSSAKGKAQADYVCDGTADNVEIQAALDALPNTGGEIHLLDGTYQLAATVARAIDNVTVSGCGFSTYVKYNNSEFLFSVGTQKRWIFKDIRFDYGRLELETGSGWAVSNIWIDDSTSKTPKQIDTWSADHIAPRSKGNFLAEAHKHPMMVLLDDFEGSDWVTDAGTLTWDTNVKRGGTQSAKIVTAPGVSSNLTKSTFSFDGTDCAFGFWIYTPNPDDIEYLRIHQMTNSSNYWYTSRYNLLTISNDWQFVVFEDVEDNIWNSPDLANTTMIRLRIKPFTDKVATVYISELYYWKKSLMNNGIVTFSFDDGYIEVETLAKPIFDKYRYKGVQSLIISRATDTKIQSSKRLQASGWDIVSHSYTHQYSSTTVNPAFQYLLAQKWLADNGFEKGSAFALLSGGIHDAKTANMLTDNLTLSRAFKSGYSSIPGIKNLELAMHVDRSTTVATVKSWVDAAKAKKMWVNIVFHTISNTPTEPYDWSPAQIDELLAHCQAQGVEVLTYSQIVDRIRSTAQKLTLSGTGTITNGSTSVNIRHGFHKEPTSIQITPTSSLGSAASIWVSSKDTGTGNLFTVSTNVDPGQDVTFDWQATL